MGREVDSGGATSEDASENEGSDSEPYKVDVADTLVDVGDTSLGVHLQEDSDSEGFGMDVSDTWKKRRREWREGNQDEA